MTIEVVVFNDNGIALAADSAASSETEIIHCSAFKIFEVSENPPVGAMTFHNSMLFNVSVEDLVKQFSNGSMGYDSLEGCANAFMDYLEEQESRISGGDGSVLVENIVRSRSAFYLNSLKKMLSHPVVENDSCDARNIFAFWVSYERERLCSVPLPSHFSEALESKVRENYSCVVDLVARSFFREFSPSDEDMEKLIDVFTYVITREFYDSPYIVFAGFGKNKLNPYVRVYELGGVFEGRLKFRDVTRNMNGIYGGGVGLITFGDDSGIWGVINGEGFDTGMLLGLADWVGNVSALDNSITRQEFDEVVDEYKSRMVGSVVDGAALNGADLSKIAKTIVELASLEQRLSERSNTIGGPVDVAFLSLVGGFEWVHKKQPNN